jgi:hypothetical protein
VIPVRVLSRPELRPSRIHELQSGDEEGHGDNEPQPAGQSASRSMRATSWSARLLGLSRVRAWKPRTSWPWASWAVLKSEQSEQEIAVRGGGHGQAPIVVGRSGEGPSLCVLCKSFHPILMLAAWSWLLFRGFRYRQGGAAAAVAFGKQAAAKGRRVRGGSCARAGHRVGQGRVVVGSFTKPRGVVGPEFFAFVQRGVGAGPVTAADAAILEQIVAAVQVDAVILHLGRSIQNAALDGHGFLERGPGFVALAQCELGLADLHPGVGELDAARVGIGTGSDEVPSASRP